MKTLEELRIEAAEAVAKIKSEVAETTERLQLMATIERASNTALTRATAMADIASSTSNKLKSLEAQCEQIVASMPIYNSKTRENRKWQPSATYGLGNQITALTRILTGIQYSAVAHKDFLLAATGLDEDLIEATIESLGSTAYYSKNYNTVVEEVSCDLYRLKDCIALIETRLGITIDTSKLTEATMNHRFTVARLKAEKDLAEELDAVALAKQKVVIA